jgi:diaminohydroxyphosphoribosylaminopyrimidine deaminase/5-amino-6-(5-phosphoribosylamino)uracil reductase
MAGDADRALMRLAIALAYPQLGRTWPNPVVGCVIAKDDRVLAEAVTGPGGANSAGQRLHAEEQALIAAGAAARGAAAYITLEPCAKRSSRRASCTDRLIAGGVARVVIACQDPSPLADGAGVRRLRDAAITVEVGLLADEAAGLYRGYWRRLAEGRPLVEAADSGDGFDAAFEPGAGEDPAAALSRYGADGYTRLWVPRGAPLEQALLDLGLIG